MEHARARWRERVEASVEAHGHHLTVVQASEVPRFAYTIGLSGSSGSELVLPGAIALLLEDVAQAVGAARDHLRTGASDPSFEVPGLGAFALGPVDASWERPLLLGALDFYDADHLPAKQIIPLGDLRTYDVPDLALPLEPAREPAWRWLRESWQLPVTAGSKAVTDLDALRGASITEAARWEEDTWEMFAGEGPSVPEDRVRIVPLGGLVGFDPTLEPVVHLEVGKALRREPPGPWRPWGD